MDWMQFGEGIKNIHTIHTDQICYADTCCTVATIRAQAIGTSIVCLRNVPILLAEYPHIRPRESFKPIPALEVRGFDRGILGDVIITSPLSSQLTVQNASIQGRAAAAAERIKNAKFQEDSSAANMLFLPFAFETYGHWGDSFGKFFC